MTQKNVKKTTENIFNDTDSNYMIKMFKSTTFHCNENQKKFRVFI